MRCALVGSGSAGNALLVATDTTALLVDCGYSIKAFDARVAALEWASDGIRLNSLNPDAVFDTGIWTEEVLMTRAAHYGMTVEGYKRKNLLKS